jgi:hypothetical protein
MMIIIVIGVFAYIVSRVDTSLNRVDAVIRETSKFSDIHEVTYKTFLALIQIAKEYRTSVEMSQVYLEKAVRVLCDMPTMDDRVSYEIECISYRLGYEFERVLIKEALNKGIEFTPKYI